MSSLSRGHLRKNIHCAARKRTFISDYDYDQDCGYDHDHDCGYDHDHDYDYDYDHDHDYGYGDEYDYDLSSSLGDKNLHLSPDCPLSHSHRHHSGLKSLAYFSPYQASILVPLSSAPRDVPIHSQHQRCRQENKVVSTRRFFAAARIRSGERYRAFPYLFPLGNMCG